LDGLYNKSIIFFFNNYIYRDNSSQFYSVDDPS